MSRKPRHASGYTASHVAHVRSTCLYVATKLGDLIDETVIVGGLVPSLLVEQSTLPTGEDRHVGTLDLDVGLALAILDDQRYFGSGIDDITARLIPLLDDASAAEALTVLEADFSDLEGVGPRRVADFLRGARDHDLQADVRGLVLDLVARCRSR